MYGYETAVVYIITFFSDLSKKEEVMQFTRSKCLVCKMLVDKGKKFQQYVHQHMKEEEVPFLCKCGGRFNSLSALRQHFKRNHKGKPDEKN